MDFWIYDGSYLYDEFGGVVWMLNSDNLMILNIKKFNFIKNCVYRRYWINIRIANNVILRKLVHF